MRLFQQILRRLTGQVPTTAERRGNERRPGAGVVLVNTAQGQVHRGRLRDVSDSGLGAILYGTVEVGSVVQLVYEYPDGTRNTRRALVKHRFGYKYGFQFVAQIERGEA